MSDVTEILQAVARGEASSLQNLLDRVYDELRQLAKRKLQRESINDSLQTTDLVHETYMRLFGNATPGFENRRHFFTAAAEAMRRILIERARKRLSTRRGAEFKRIDADLDHLYLCEEESQKILALNVLLEQLEETDPRKANLVKLRFFSGLSIKDTAELLEISTATADRQWRFVRSWLQANLKTT